MIKTCGFLVSLAAGTLSAGIATANDAAVEGKLTFDRWCQGCHADSHFAPGTIYLRSVREPEFAVIENNQNLSRELVAEVVRRGRGGMPSFRRTEISKQELEALIDYLTRWSEVEEQGSK